MSVFRRGSKADKGKRDNKSPPPPPMVCSPSGEEGFERFKSLPEEQESSLRSQRSTSDASALTRKSEQPSLSETGQEMELEEVTDGATGGASGGDKEKKKSRKLHLPGTKKKKVQEAEKERLQTELQRLEIQKDAAVHDEKKKWDAVLKTKAKELQGKDDTIKLLREEIEGLSSSKDALEVTRGKLQAVSQRERTAQRELASTQQELASTQQELASTNDTLQNLQHEVTHSQGQHQREIEDLNRKHQAQIRDVEADSKRKISELEGERDRLNQQLCQEQNNMKGELEKIRELEEERDGLTRQLTEVRQERDNTKGELEKIRELEEERDRLNQQLIEMSQERDNVRGELEEARDLKGERNQLVEQLTSVEQERDRVKKELEKGHLDCQLEKEKLEKSLREELTKEVQARQTVKQQMELKFEEIQATALQDRDHLTAELERKVQQLEQELKEKEDTIVALQDEQQQQPPPPPQLAPPPVDQSAGDAAKKLKKLETKCYHLESENQRLRTQVGEPIPSNVHHFCHQLSKLVDPQGESAETTSRPFVVQDVIPLLQAMGCGVEYKPKGYVIALFHAFNQSQSILLDYTRIGEVVQLKGPGEYLDTSDAGEEVEKSPYSSLDGVKVAVTDGNMTDTDKLELERMLRESQEKLEKLQVENTNLLELLQNQSPESKEEEVPNPHPADVPQQQAGSPGQEPKALRELKAKYLLLHGEKMQLLEKLEERDAQLQQLREESLRERDDRPPVSHPDVERSLSTGDVSPDDPKAEIRKLRKVIEEKDVKMENLYVQLRSFDAVASAKTSLEKEIAQMKTQLEAAKAEIKALSDRSELTQVYNSLRAELARTREDVSNSEERAADAEVENDILKNEISAEKDNNQNLQSEVARLTAALHFYETKYPQGDEEGLCGLADGAMKPEKDGEIVQLKTKVTDLQSRISQKEAAVMSLTKSRRTVESRLQRVQEERDRLAEQVAALVAVRDNLKGELKDTVKVREYASQLQVNVMAKETEAEGWKKGKEKMIKEIQDLQDDLAARRQEVAMVTEDYKQTVAECKGKANQWRVQQQQYEEDFGKLDRRFKHLTHESQQREMRLTLKLEEKVDELKRVMGNAVERQREFDAVSEQLGQELDEVKTDRDRYQEERDRYRKERDHHKDVSDTWKDEYQTVLHVHEEKKQEHETELSVWKVKHSTLENHVRQMEGEALQKEKACELAASSNRQLNNQLQEIARQLNAEKQEKGQLSARLTALDRQYRSEAEKWQADKNNMDCAITDMSKQVQELQRIQSQADILKGRVQTERKKVQQLERELQSSQELLRKIEEDHKSDIEYTKAKCDNERLELERKVTPLRRELEMLRTQTFVDTKFAETYRRMDVERKEMREEMQQLGEQKDGLRKELDTLTAQFHSMVDDYTVAREYILQNNLPLPRRKVGVQYDIQTQPAQMSPSCEWVPGISWGANHGSFSLNSSGPGGTSGAHTTCCEKPQSTYPRTPDEVKVRPYLGEKATFPPTSEGYSSQRFRHLGEDRPPVQDNVSLSYPAETRQSERSVRAQTSNFENCPQDKQFNYNQKMVSKSSCFEKHGSVEYGPKQQGHPIMDRQLQQQLQEHACQQNQQPRGQQPMSQRPQQPVSQPSQQPMIPQQPAVRQPGIQHGQQPPVQQLGVHMQHGGQQPQPGMQHGQQPQPGMQHGQQPQPGMQHGQQPQPGMQHRQQPQPGMQHGQQPQPGMQHGQQLGMQQPGMQHGQQPAMQHGQMGGALYNPPQQNRSMTNAPSQPYQQGSPPRSQQPRSQQPRSPKPGAPVNIPQSHNPAVSRAAGGQQQPGVYPAANPQTPQSKRPLNPLTPQENVLLQSIETDISEAAAEVRKEVFTSMSSVESTPGGDEPMSLPQDPNLVCPMCKRQFKIGQIQSYRAHVDSCTG